MMKSPTVRQISITCRERARFVQNADDLESEDDAWEVISRASILPSIPNVTGKYSHHTGKFSWRVLLLDSGAEPHVNGKRRAYPVAIT